MAKDKAKYQNVSALMAIFLGMKCEFDSNITFMISCRATKRKIAVRSIRQQCK